MCYVNEGPCVTQGSPEEGTVEEHGRVCSGNTPVSTQHVCVACSVLEYVFLHIPSCFIESLFLFVRVHLSKLDSNCYALLLCLDQELDLPEDYYDD